MVVFCITYCASWHRAEGAYRGGAPGIAGRLFIAENE